ncbi:MAG: hypothetical protein M3Z26_02025 [Bacteroidota bacterium]|nr:hypothetical protein [Bacteroidota bacterium]
MKQIFTLLFLLNLGNVLYAQDLAESKKYSSSITSSHRKEKPINFNGQWKGGFDETTYGFSGLGGNDIIYVLELNTEGTKVSGYSYTYFQEGNKRYYTICRLTGSLDREAKEIVVTEIERTKFNTPPDFQNCFQTHRLHYEKDSGDVEVLRGTWIPGPNQGAGCGSGTTVLSRRIINNLPLGIKKPERKDIVKSPLNKHVPQKQTSIISKKTIPAIAKTIPHIKPKIEKPHTSTSITETPIHENPIIKPEISSTTTITAPDKRFEHRRKDIVKTITIEQPTFRLDFYDNGIVDGDSITVFFNGKIVLLHKMLSEKPITLTLALDKNVKENVITMYADNLGTIPPNTALMIVTDGDKRYEVRMESDYGKSGTVIFQHE